MRAGPRVLLAFYGAFAFCAVPPAGARELSGKEQQRIRNVAVKFADCVVKRRAPTARALILGNVDRGVIAREALSQVAGDCLIGATGRSIPVKMTFPGDYFLYAMAEALVRTDYAVPAVFDFQDRPLINKREMAPFDPAQVVKGGNVKEAEEKHRVHVAFHKLGEWGQCVARNDPAKAHALILTAAGSAEEAVAIAALSQVFGSCLEAGQMRINREMARGALALNFYRLAGPPAGASIKTLKVS